MNIVISAGILGVTAVFCIGLLLPVSHASSLYPICAATSFDYMGFIDIASMLYNCTNNIPSSNDPARLFQPLCLAKTLLITIPYYAATLQPHQAEKRIYLRTYPFSLLSIT